MSYHFHIVHCSKTVDGSSLGNSGVALVVVIAVFQVVVVVVMVAVAVFVVVVVVAGAIKRRVKLK